METISNRDILPSGNPNSFHNCKGLLELVNIYNNDVSELRQNYRKWALQYHPDKGAGEKDFFALVTNCVRMCCEYLERHNLIASSLQSVEFRDLAEGDKIRYIDAEGTDRLPHFGIVAGFHPPSPWPFDRTHVVLVPSTDSWQLPPQQQQVNKLYVRKEALCDLCKCSPNHSSSSSTGGIQFPINGKHAAYSSSASAPSFPYSSSAASPAAAPTAHPTAALEEVSWRDLRPGDKIYVSWSPLKAPSATPLSSFGVFRGVPTYSEVVEFVKTDEHFTPLSNSVSVINLAGSNCKFRRLRPSFATPCMDSAFAKKRKTGIV